MKPWLSLIIALSFFAYSQAEITEMDQLLHRVDQVVKRHFPDAEISQKEKLYSAKDGTMKFIIHRHSKTGEIYPKTDEVEGPNFKGFMLSITTSPGIYNGQAAIPQTLNQRYWKTFIDRPTAKDGKNYYVINYSFGSRIDPKFHKELHQVLPNSGDQAKREQQLFKE